jgi:hypothetical protein
MFAFFESIFAFFAFGTIGFYILAVVASIVLITLLENECYKLPFFITGVLALVYWKTIAAFSWSGIGLFLIIYVAIGAVWSLYRWFRRVRIIAQDYEKWYSRSLTEGQMREIQRETDPSRHKSLITTWIFYWPWSLLWNVFGDIITTVFESLQKAYANITKRSISKFTVKQENNSQDL